MSKTELLLAELGSIENSRLQVLCKDSSCFSGRRPGTARVGLCVDRELDVHGHAENDTHMHVPLALHQAFEPAPQMS